MSKSKKKRKPKDMIHLHEKLLVDQARLQNASLYMEAETDRLTLLRLRKIERAMKLVHGRYRKGRSLPYVV